MNYLKDTSQASDVPTEAEFLKRASDLVPVLRARSAQANERRSVPQETIDDFQQAGFFRLLQPRRFGGYEADYGLFSEVLEQLAQGCGSSAWVCSVLAEHPWFVSYFSDQAQEEIWGPNPNARISASFSPKPVEPVGGGYRVTGQWSFSSGCDHAQWAFLGGASPAGLLYMLVPMAEIEIVDDWHAMGLRGTGSKSLKLSEVFVPAHRTVPMMPMMMGALDPSAHSDNYLPRTIPMRLAPYSLPSVIIGLGQRALDKFAASIERSPGPPGVPPADFDHLQYVAGECAAEIDVLRTRIRTRCRSEVARARAGRAPDGSPQDARSDFRLVSQRMVQIVLKLCDLSGARWVYESDPMQMIARDVITASAHRGASWDSFLGIGRRALGMSPV